MHADREACEHGIDKDFCGKCVFGRPSPTNDAPRPAGSAVIDGPRCEATGCRIEHPHGINQHPAPEADARGRCGSCGGPHQFDTSIPSPLWNEVVRARCLPEFLCISCIVIAFVGARRSFSAELYGPPVNRSEGVPTINVQVGQIPIENTYGDLEYRLRAAESALARTRKELEEARRGCSDRDNAGWAQDQLAGMVLDFFEKRPHLRRVAAPLLDVARALAGKEEEGK